MWGRGPAQRKTIFFKVMTNWLCLLIGRSGHGRCFFRSFLLRRYKRHWYAAQNRQSAKLFLQSSELGTPQPSPAGECATPPPRFWGEGHTRWRHRGWESPNSDGDIHCGTLVRTCTLIRTFVVCRVS
jgi:hypothetical protein